MPPAIDLAGVSPHEISYDCHQCPAATLRPALAVLRTSFGRGVRSHLGKKISVFACQTKVKLPALWRSGPSGNQIAAVDTPHQKISRPFLWHAVPPARLMNLTPKKFQRCDIALLRAAPASRWTQARSIYLSAADQHRLNSDAERELVGSNQPLIVLRGRNAVIGEAAPVLRQASARDPQLAFATPSWSSWSKSCLSTIGSTRRELWSR